MPIHNIVFSGAEIRGISYIGIIKAIEELNINDNIKNILGVSSGAIFATTLVLGLSSSQLEKIIMSLSIGQLFNFSTDNILNIVDTYGIDDGEKITRIFKILFKKILKNEHATFKDLHEFNSSKNLVISGTNLYTKKSEFFSYQTTPDMPLYIAIRISTSIPICFNAVNYNNSMYIDGAFSNNFPINYFKEDIKNTLGIIISEVKTTNKEINTLGDYMYTITDCVLGIMPNYLKHLYNNNIIEIEVEYNVLELKFNSVIKKHLVYSGYAQFLEKYKLLFGDEISTDTVKSENPSSNEKVEEIIEDMNKEIKVMNEETKIIARDRNNF